MRSHVCWCLIWLFWAPVAGRLLQRGPWVLQSWWRRVGEHCAGARDFALVAHQVHRHNYRAAQQGDCGRLLMVFPTTHHVNTSEGEAGDVSCSDGAVLPMECLSEVLRTSFDMPWTFRLKVIDLRLPEKVPRIPNQETTIWEKDPKRTFLGSAICGVSSFQAPKGCILLPPWLMAYLSVEAGEVVLWHPERVARARFAELVLVDFATGSATGQVGALEETLKFYTALNVGAVVQLDSPNGKLMIFVKNLADERGALRAGSVQNTDLRVALSKSQRKVGKT